MPSHSNKPADGNLRVPHTPGPWYARKWEGEGWPERRFSVGPSTTQIATAVAITPRYATAEQAEADVSLIAAAPEMLQLLLEGMRGFETHIDFVTWQKRVAMVTDNIRY